MIKLINLGMKPVEKIKKTIQSYTLHMNLHRLFNIYSATVL
jgi:hypothetical protein